MKVLRLLVCAIILLSTQLFSIEKKADDFVDESLEKANQKQVIDEWVKNNPKKFEFKKLSK